MAKKRYLPRVCEGCGQEYKPRQFLQSYCSTLCRQNSQKRFRRDGKLNQERSCEFCRNPYVPFSSKQKWCSIECARIGSKLTKNEAVDRDNHYKNLYGISLEEYNELLKSQNRLCAICGLPDAVFFERTGGHLYVDHCHETGRVRGLLCNACNTALGLFKDRLVIICNALEYLQESRDREE